MRPLDWERVLREHRVSFITSGANVRRGELNIRCPFCGSADPSYHMGLSLETGWWSCWRNRAAHSGKSPLRLLMKLLRVPYRRAREIAGLGLEYVDPEGFDALAARLLYRGQEARPEQVQARRLHLDPEFLEIRNKLPTRAAWEYLCDDRGFSGSSGLGEDVDVLCRQYGLLTAVRGDYRQRIVFPFWEDGCLVTWTARAMGDSQIRYKGLPEEERLVAPKDTLYNHDALYRGGRALVIVEGQVDVLKLDFYGKAWGVRAVGLSTATLSDEQAYLLQPAADLFDEVLVMADNASRLGLVDSMRLAQSLDFIPNVRAVPVPCGAKDAGALRPSEVISWAQALNSAKRIT